MVNPNELVLIGKDTKDDASHPLYDERVNSPIDDGMLFNIRTFGVIEPVVVWKDRENDGRLVVVDGRRRVLHARKARLPEIPVVYTTHEDLEGVAVSMNEVRKDTSPLTKANRMYAYVERLQAKNDEPEKAASVRADAIKRCAVIFGYSTKQVENYLALNDCSAKVKRAIDSGRLSATAASNLAKLEKEEQDKKLEQLLKNGRATVRQTKAATTKKPRGLFYGKREVKRLTDAWYECQNLEDGQEPEDPKLVELFEASGLSDDFWWGMHVAIGELDPDEADDTGNLKKMLKHVSK